jgi:hypothetical protein
MLLLVGFFFLLFLNVIKDSDLKCVNTKYIGAIIKFRDGFAKPVSAALNAIVCGWLTYFNIKLIDLYIEPTFQYEWYYSLIVGGQILLAFWTVMRTANSIHHLVLSTGNQRLIKFFEEDWYGLV